jgi:hypothetical protein
MKSKFRGRRVGRLSGCSDKKWAYFEPLGYNWGLNITRLIASDELSHEQKSSE